MASQVVGENKVTWTVKSLPFKSPRLGDMFTALHQKELVVILAKVCTNRERYIPRAWGEIKVIFIPKPKYG